MKSKALIAVVLILILSLLATAIPGCYFPYRPFEEAESWLSTVYVIRTKLLALMMIFSYLNRVTNIMFTIIIPVSL